MIEKFLEDINNREKLYKAFDEVNEIDIIDDETDCISNKKILCKNFLLNILKTKKKEFSSTENKKLNLKTLLLKKLVTGDKIIEILEKFPSTNRNIGSIPQDFFIEIDKKNYKTFALKLYETLAKYSLILNYDYTCDKDDEDYIECRDKELAEELTKLLKQTVSVNYSGHGCNGNGFKISFNNKNYFYKVFYLHNKPDKISIEKHGSNAEIPFAYFAEKKGRKGQFAKFHFGRLSSRYEKDCFMVTEFLEKQERKSPKKLYIDYININPDEYRRSDNKINGKIVDFGGLIESDIQDLKNPAIRRLVRVIFKHINYQYNPNIFETKWEINEANLLSLKRYVITKADYNLYTKSIDIIEQTIHNIPKAIITTLKAIKNNAKPIKVIETLLPSHIIVQNLDILLKNIEHYELKIKTGQKAQNNNLGYLIVDLNNNKHAVIRFDENNIIHEIRFEKIENGKVDVIQKFTGCDMEKCKLKNFSGILY